MEDKKNRGLEEGSENGVELYLPPSDVDKPNNDCASAEPRLIVIPTTTTTKAEELMLAQPLNPYRYLIFKPYSSKQG
jgi:hypothetical protein